MSDIVQERDNCFVQTSVKVSYNFAFLRDQQTRVNKRKKRKKLGKGGGRRKEEEKRMRIRVRSRTDAWVGRCRRDSRRVKSVREERKGKGGRGTYPCFHTGGTSDARYGASRPALTAPYNRCTV